MSIMGTNKYIPRRAVHPSEIIKEEIKSRGISKTELAERLGMKKPNISRLLTTSTDITVPLAMKLEEALGISADSWLSLQTQYNRVKEMIALRDAKEDKAAKTENLLSNLYNLSLLYRRLGIDATKFIYEKLAILLDYLGEDLLLFSNRNISMHGAFKKSKHETSIKNQNTWLVLAFISARRNKPLLEYSQGNAEKAAVEICSLVHKECLKEVDIKNILSSYGISYSVVEKLEHTPIDGYSTWINDYPAIITTHRYNDMNRLVFDVLHELGHIHLHFNDDKEVSFLSTEEFDNTNIELEANKFAQDHLISIEKWNSLMNMKVDSLFNNKIVQKLTNKAKELGLNPNIVLWRYRFENQLYALQGVKTNPIQ